MRIIANLSDFIKDEAKSVKMYAKMATKYKAENKEIADMFFNMANTEMTHLDNMHSWIVKFIEKEKKERMEPIPQGMLDVWSWQHEKIIEELTEAKIMLQNYQKV